MEETFNKYLVNRRIIIFVFEKDCEDRLKCGLEWEIPAWVAVS